MIDLKQGSIVLVDFTYSDQVHTKLRPALVVSNSKYNRISRDVIVLKITSNEPRIFCHKITNADLVSGSLDLVSFVQVDGIYALEKTIIYDVIGMVNPGTIRAVQQKITDLLSPDPALPRG